MRITRLILLLFGLLLGCSLHATHNRAGEITYRHLGGFQYEVTIITYTKSDSPADRPDLGISWGDGSVDTIPRINGLGLGELVAPSIKMNRYIGVHTYPGPSIYLISFEDPNRNGGLVNIPNSVNVPFYVSSELVINPFLGINNSVQLLNPPIDEACPGQIFIHNPGAYDPDGDSISYRISVCLGEDGLSIPGFNQPQASNNFTLDPVTGDLVWDAPLPNGVGEYNVAFIVEEWRRGVRIGYVTRDMQINVVPCSNQPPVINPIPDLCVDAGSLVNFQVQASDADSPAQSITLSATGGPFQFSAPFNAVFAGVTQLGNVSQNFTWQTNCTNVRKQPYSFSFKVIDNGNPNLADFESVSIQVVAQAPENLQASALGATILLSWNQSPCEQATGYAIYRRSGFYGFIPSQCETGVPSYTGFSFLANVQGLTNLTYTDLSPLLPGASYCYMVVALFGDGAESYASNEACVQLQKVLPVITNVSIETTSSASGSIYIAWSKPTSIDTSQYPGPYRYIIERAPFINGTNFSTIDSLNSINDTLYTDNSVPLNTSENAWTYRISMKNVTEQAYALMGTSTPASSVFLSASGLDNQINLQWETDVPWDNDSFFVYRKTPSEIQYDSIGYSINRQYKDVGLANGVEYCYKIQSKGAYSGVGFIHPILNFSQEVCSSAKDTEAPCPPSSSVIPDCDSLKNEITWNFPANDSCFSDAVRIRIYFSPTSFGQMQILTEFPIGMQNNYIHSLDNVVAGCYAVAAIDSFQNESILVQACVDNCPVYELPNTFSPNIDGINDYFEPFPYAFIASVQFDVYNRWGNKVFSSTNPDILWDGNDTTSGNKLPDGVYFYVCQVEEIRLDNNVIRTLKGTITLFGSNSKNGN